MNNRMMMVGGVVVAVVVIIVLAFLLGIVGGGGLSEADAEDALKAGMEGDFDKANEFICEKDQSTAETSTVPEGTTVKDVTCTKDGEKMACDVKFEFGGQEQTLSMTWSIEDDKLCSPELDIPGVEIPDEVPTEPAAQPTEASN